MRVITFFLSFLFCLGAASANGKKQPPISISFHMEAADVQSKKFAVPVDTPQGKRFIEKVPTISTKDIVAYWPFPSPHNPEHYGVSLQLDKHAARRLNLLSAQNNGKWMIATINGQVVDMLYIDKQVDGRIITVWRGVDGDMVKLCGKALPKIGESKKEWKKSLKSKE